MIVVFGSINTDLIIETPALPRPGETVLAPGYRVLPGGENQIVVAFGAEASWRIGALGVEARDTTGAGDAFVGVLAAALDCELTDTHFSKDGVSLLSCKVASIGQPTVWVKFRDFGADVFGWTSF